MFIDEIKDEIQKILVTGVVTTGARLVSVAVMDNHFHLILFQASAPLGWTMQSINRRIALLVHRVHDLKGHVFERRFRTKLCHDPEHLPNAILYVHRNPVEAGICARPSDYRWSSAAAYEGKCDGMGLCIESGLREFGNSSSIEALREAYAARLARRTTADDIAYWKWFTARPRRRSREIMHAYEPQLRARRLPDLRDVARELLFQIDSNAPIDVVRSRYGGPKIVAARTRLIAELHRRGYAGVSISKYMNVSQTAVSRIRSQMRWGLIDM